VVEETGKNTELIERLAKELHNIWIEKLKHILAGDEPLDDEIVKKLENHITTWDDLDEESKEKNRLEASNLLKIVGDNEYKKIFVYGTLRRGCGNYYAFLDRSDVKFCGVEKKHGYALYSNNIVAYMVKTGNKEDYVVGEVYLVPDKIYKKISQMNTGANYKEVYEDGEIFWTYEKPLPNAVKIESGDYLKYNKQFLEYNILS